eukprot:5300567-Amphidinium_carterae.1
MDEIKVTIADGNIGTNSGTSGFCANSVVRYNITTIATIISTTTTTTTTATTATTTTTTTTTTTLSLIHI